MENIESVEAIICQLCREPIWNFLCIDCLGKNVEQWLPKNFSKGFSAFHREIKSHFHTLTADNYEPCLDCSKVNETPICPYCYTQESYHWVAAQNQEIAASFKKIFFFYPFEGTEKLRVESHPIEASALESFLPGFCDRCSEYSESLGKDAEGLHCESCKDT